VTDFATWQHLTTLLAIRSGHACEICGETFRAGGAEPSRHHRRPGQKGGRTGPEHDNLANLLLACGGALAGVRGCHGAIEANREAAYSRGFLVHSWDDPTQVPVILRSGRRVLLDPVIPWYVPAPGPAYALDAPELHNL
jgi:hypothetical protein